MAQKEHKIGYASIYTIIHKELHVKKNSFFHQDFIERQTAEHDRICKEILKLFENGRYRLTSKIITYDETYIPLFDIPMRQESKILFFEDHPNEQWLKNNEPTKEHCISFSLEVQDW